MTFNEIVLKKGNSIEFSIPSNISRNNIELILSIGVCDNFFSVRVVKENYQIKSRKKIEVLFDQKHFLVAISGISTLYYASICGTCFFYLYCFCPKHIKIHINILIIGSVFVWCDKKCILCWRPF